MKKVMFTIADQANMPYATKMINSFKKFHPDVDIKIYTEKEVGDKVNYYRATPMFARELIKDYDVVLKMDADQIVTGNLDYIFNSDYDVASVINFNRVDPSTYGFVKVWDIHPVEYFNCGLVAMKNKDFIEHWWALCNGPHFENYQYREQDLLNIICHYGQYSALNLDAPFGNYRSWHGLLSKGEWPKIKLVGDELILPAAKDQYPEHDKTIRVIHWAGGDGEKMNYRKYFTEDVIKRLDYLCSPEK